MLPRKASSPALILVAATLCSPVFLRARPVPQEGQPTPSLADAARKARSQQEQQKKEQTKSAKVFTNDDLDRLSGPISVVGSAPAPEAKPAEAAVAAGAKPANAPEAQGEDYWRKRFADGRKTLADDSKELDVLQREFNLKQEQYYSNPNVALQQQYSRKDLDDTQQQIDTKKQDVDKDNQAISDLEDEMRKAGGDPAWAREPQPQQQPQP